MKASKELKKTGKIVVKGPKVKDRKKFAPATKVEKSKKTYDRKKETFDEDEQGHGAVPMKDGSKPKRRPLEGKRKKPYSFNESNNIADFIEAVLTKNYSKANKHLKQSVEAKVAEKIQGHLNTPLF